MTVQEFYEKLDSLPESMSDGEREAIILAACGAFDMESPEDYRGRCAMYNELGAFYRARGVWDKGESAFLKAKSLLEDGSKLVEIAGGCACCGGDSCDLTNTTLVDLISTPDYATTLNNLAGLYRMSGRRAEAMETFAAAQTIYNACPDTPADVAASCSNNLGLLYLDEKRYEEAKQCFDTAMQKLGDMKNDYARATTWSNLAFAALGLGRRSEGLDNMRKAADLFALCDRQMEAMCRQYLGRLEESVK